MVFTIVNSIEFTFRKYENMKNGHLSHYDSFRGGGSHMVVVLTLLVSVTISAQDVIVALEKMVCPSNLPTPALKVVSVLL